LKSYGVVVAARVRRGNLPDELTSFVGRRAELKAVRPLLGESRLVTLTGFGGVGKTRLALRVGEGLERVYRDGVWLVDLAPLRDPGLVAATVAASLGLRDESAGSWMELLTDYLQDRELLLVMDNCEHLLDPCAVLVETLLRSAPGLRILATSRQALGVPGEHTFPVRPLRVPAGDGMPATTDAVAQYDAMVLLVDRARVVAPQFSITDVNVAAVAQLVNRLEGIPLALELAAARLRVLSPQQVLERLDDRFNLLSGGARTAPPHQQSLRALIDWSFDLCSIEERLLWARLSEFPSDLEVDAAEDICSGDGLAREAILDALTGLVEKSIVVTDPNSLHVRYRLLDTLREYGRTHLDDPREETERRRRHSAYYLRLGDQLFAEWFGPRQAEVTALINAEYVNLRAALVSGLAEPEAAAEVLMMFPPLYIAWSVGGSYMEGRRLLDRALVAAPQPSRGRAYALWIAAAVAMKQGDLLAGEHAGSEALVVAQEHGDSRALGAAMEVLGGVRVLAGDLASGESLLRDALSMATARDPLIAAQALARLADAADRRDDAVAVSRWFAECVELCESHGELWIRATALAHWATFAMQQTDTVRATELARRSLRIRSGFGDRHGIAESLDVLAWVAAAEATYDKAARLLAAAQALRQEVGSSQLPHLAPLHEACEVDTRRALGDREFQEAVEYGEQDPLPDVVAYALGEKPPAAATDGDVVALTRRELEVADLVAEGLSNRQIADKLVISPRTAEAHVEHILLKLGFTSRARIMAWVSEHGANPRVAERRVSSK
jgi:predicted ATPase/DNA-binding CsgD family transcriptional regulator